MPKVHSEHDQRFRDHVMPHEPMGCAWLRSQFPDVADVVQESSISILRAKEKGEVTSPKAFLFATARNLAIGRVRQEIRHAKFSLADLDKLGVLDDGEDVRAAIARPEELEFLTQVIQSLPDRCRQIITLRGGAGKGQPADRWLAQLDRRPARERCSNQRFDPVGFAPAPRRGCRPRHRPLHGVSPLRSDAKWQWAEGRSQRSDARPR